MDIRIRQATGNDIEAVHQMEIQWAREDIVYGFVPTDANQLIKRLGPYFLVAEDGKDAFGFAYGSLRTSEHHDHLAVIPAGQRYFELDAMYVEPESRDRGVGGALLESLIAAARSDNIARFNVFTAAKDQERIIRFYRRHGFTPWGAQLFI